MIISIEGPDFVGKNTLVNELLKLAPIKFPDMKIKLLQFPNTDTEIGKICRKMLLKKDWSYKDGVIFQLLNTAHRYEYFEDLNQAKEDDSFLLFIIRYNLSGPVYASIDGLDATKTWNLYSWFDELLPDHTFIISRKFNFDTLLKERDPDHYEEEGKQEKVRKIYDLADVLWSNRLGKVTKIVNDKADVAVNSLLDILSNSLQS